MKSQYGAYFFKDKVVWITGASSGIGKSLASAFCKVGAKVIISARNIDNLNKVKNECLPSESIKVLPIDLEEINKAEDVTKRAISCFGKIDILINNAGISQRGMAVDTGVEIDKRIINTNLLGTIALTKAVLPNMIAQESGQIVTISSVLGKFGAPTRTAYSASKHGLHGFFDSLRAEIYKHNINITMLCPGYIKTNISLNALDKDGKPHNKLDEGQANGISTEEFAKRAIAAIYKKKNEAYIGGIECGGIYLKRFFPRIFAWVIRRVKIN